jgi:glycosyltransferase involved in cell wall biosynthesis
MFQHLTVAAVVPCYRVGEAVLDVLARMPAEVDRIFCIDDACPEGSGRLISERCTDPRVTVITHAQNRGVGGAVKTGYEAARAAGCDVAVKIDGDGQMNPRLLPAFVQPIAAGQADYTKGNRFFRIEDARRMPRLRLFGNAVLSFMSKLSTGYWNLFDPTNGYTALHLSLLDLVPLRKVADRYFFETDLLFRLSVVRAVARDVPMVAVYGEERSSLSVAREVLPFLAGNARNLVKRLFYSYLLRDFHVATVQVLIGLPALLGGILFGGWHWWKAAAAGQLASAGTVMIAGLLIIVGTQLLLAAMSFDVANVPRDPVHPLLEAAKATRDAPGSDKAGAARS